ncbi:MAG: hypothetical protein EOP62_14255 [Sphingomonadales bacterium]|nr:MAG: hypothetical protein EOP62_14255 [Sphingomonadales bacterium]
MNALRPISVAGDLQDELAAVIGQGAVTRLIERMGGTRTYVPRTIGAHHPIAATIGLKPASLLAEYFHGRTLDLPKAHARRQRALETALNRPEGVTLKQVALDFDYTERHLYNLLEAHKAAHGHQDDGQLGLFD